MAAARDAGKKMKRQKYGVIISAGNGPVEKSFVEPGRNSPCVCGSGKKYKHCCLDKLNSPVRESVISAALKSQEDGVEETK